MDFLPTAPTRTAPPRRAALLTVGVLIAAGWLMSIVTTAQGWFYWDDLILSARVRAEQTPWPLLGRLHDGHLMPGAWLLEWILGHAAPLNWAAAVAVAALLQLVALAAVARAVWLLTPQPSPWRIGVPVALYALAPLTMPASTWLAAAVNALPLHAAFALAVAYLLRAVRAAEPHRVRRDAALAAAGTLGGLVFSERALAIAPAALLLILALCLAGADQLRLRRVAAACAPTLLVSALWLVLYGWAAAVDTTTSSDAGQLESFDELLRVTYLEVLLPAAAGGPWLWERWHPGPPFAAAPLPAAALLGGVVVFAVLAGTWWRRGRAMWLWLPLAVYPLLPTAALVHARSSADSSALMAATMRHISEAPVLLALTAALLCGRTAAPAIRAPRRRWEVAVPVMACVVAIAAVGVSNTNYLRAWSEQPARTYFETLRAQAATLPESETLLDQPVGLEVLLPVVYPDNQLSRQLAGAPGYPPVAPYTHSPFLVDDAGHLQPAELLAVRRTEPGPEPSCGWRLNAAAGNPTAVLPLDGPLIENGWTVQAGYFASGAGTMELSLGAGEPVQVPLYQGLHQMTVRLVGDGSEVHVRADAAAGDTCVSEVQVGGLVPAR